MKKEDLHAAQDQLEALIKLASATRIECCKRGDTANRDILGNVIGHLYHALAAAGPLDFGGDVQTRSGDK